MNHLAINGTLLSDPKVLKLDPLLLYVKLHTTTDEELNCLVHQHGLNFLYQATSGSRVAIYGHYNAHRQFIIEKFTVLANANAVAS
ncbi:hypothetical protein [Levilactobacillus tujiorum]|uniref:Uncharacterized protein n=1 Tax=Levilactobacillus tujiorum TaxID=2912243 RepID=A0ABX1L9B9_9LACO|nr:hypothetical protein [Levilactobacillus tujiorum]MCH5464681.1 hypothetical protein [Levilactobacillus tujiorum]NLR11839.1 hypothetical protein [Lactobacillus sp. HBUAS51387]NLR29660.1 hypothetical protein [Levilactobacillus tujiorum]